MAREKQDKYSFFDELRTVTRKSVFEIKSIYGVSALRDVTVGTVTQADGEYQLQNSGNGDLTVLDTAQRCPYISGFVTEPGMGIRPSSRPTGDTKIQFGPFGDDDGFFFEYNAIGLYGGVRRAGVDTLTLFSAWSENDTLFADTQRAKEFDPTDGFIYQLPYSWYAFGPAQWEYQIRDLDPVNTMWLQELGESRPAGATSITDPQQPIRVRVETGVGDPAYTLYVGGRQCSIIGDYSLSQRETSIETTVSSVTDSAWVPAFAIRRTSVTPYALTNLDSLSIRATGDIRVLIEQNGNAPSGTFVTPADYSANETLLEVNTAPGSTKGNGVSLQKLHVFTGTPSNPSGSQTPLERTPLIEQKNQIVYVRRFAGESSGIDVDVLATFTEGF